MIAMKREGGSSKFDATTMQFLLVSIFNTVTLLQEHTTKKR